MFRHRCTNNHSPPCVAFFPSTLSPSRLASNFPRPPCLLLPPFRPPVRVRQGPVTTSVRRRFPLASSLFEPADASSIAVVLQLGAWAGSLLPGCRRYRYFDQAAGFSVTGSLAHGRPSCLASAQNGNISEGASERERSPVTPWPELPLDGVTCCMPSTNGRLITAK